MYKNENVKEGWITYLRARALASMCQILDPALDASRKERLKEKGRRKKRRNKETCWIDSELWSRLTGKESTLICGLLLQTRVNFRVETRWKDRVAMMEDGGL